MGSRNVADCRRNLGYSTREREQWSTAHDRNLQGFVVSCTVCNEQRSQVIVVLLVSQSDRYCALSVYMDVDVFSKVNTRNHQTQLEMEEEENAEL